MELTKQTHFIIKYAKMNLLGLSKILKKHAKKFPESGFDFFSERSVSSCEYHLYKLIEIEDIIQFLYSIYYHQDTSKKRKNSVDSHNLKKVDSKHVLDIEKMDISDELLEKVIETIQVHKLLRSKLGAFADQFDEGVHRQRVYSMLYKNIDFQTNSKMIENVLEPSPVPEGKEKLDKNNLLNMRLSTSHPLIYICAYTMVHSITTNYVKKLGINADYAGLMSEFTSIMSIVGGLIFGVITNTRFRTGYIWCNMVCVVAYFFYCIAAGFETTTGRFISISISRILMGIGNAKAISRRYVLHFAPKSQIRKFSFEYSALMAFGAALGPFSNWALKHLELSEEISPHFFQLNKYSIFGYLAAFMMFIHTLLLVFLFKDPYDTDFKIKEEEEILGQSMETQNVLVSTPKSTINTINTNSKSEVLVPIREELQVDEMSLVKVTLIVVSLSLFVERAMQETVLNVVWYFNLKVLHEETFDQGELALLVASVSLLGFVFILGLNKLNKVLEERQMVLYLFIMGAAGAFFCINIFMNNIFYYFIGYTLIFLSGNALEGVLSSLFSKNLPSKYSTGTFNAGFLVLLLTSIGKFMGGSSTSINKFIDNPSETITWIYSITFLLLISQIVVVLVYYKDLVVKLSK